MVASRLGWAAANALRLSNAAIGQPEYGRSTGSCTFKRGSNEGGKRPREGPKRAKDSSEKAPKGP
eukprot:8601593-Pyramimonas_sp.AAC.1